MLPTELIVEVWTSKWIGWSWPEIGTSGICSVHACADTTTLVPSCAMCIAISSSAVVSVSTRPEALTWTLRTPSTAARPLMSNVPPGMHCSP